MTISEQQFIRRGINFGEISKKKRRPILRTIELRDVESLGTHKAEMSIDSVRSCIKEYFQLIFRSVNVDNAIPLDENKVMFLLEVSTKEDPTILSKVLVLINFSKESMPPIEIDTQCGKIKLIDIFMKLKLDFVFIFSRGPVLSHRLRKTYRGVTINRLMLIRELDDRTFLHFSELKNQNLSVDEKKILVIELEDQLEIAISFSKLVDDLKKMGLVIPNLWSAKIMGQEGSKLATHFLTDLFTVEEAKHLMKTDKKECKQWLEQLSQMGFLENINKEYRFKTSTVWEERLYNILAESKGALRISELSRNFFSIPSCSRNLAYLLQLMEGKGLIIRNKRIPRPYYQIVQPEVKKVELIKEIERVKKDMPEDLLNSFQDKILNLQTNIEQLNHIQILERLNRYKVVEKELALIDREIACITERRNIRMEAILEEMEEVYEIEEEFSRMEFAYPLKEKILHLLAEISKNLDLSSDYAYLFDIKRAEEYFNSATKKLEILKEDDDFIEVFRKVQQKLKIQKEAKATIAAIKRLIEFTRKFIEDSPTLSQFLALDTQLDTQKSLYSELEDALTKEEYNQIIEKGQRAKSKEDLEEQTTSFLEDLYKKAQQITGRAQEILKDFEILQFTAPKEYFEEVDRNLLKGRALMDEKHFENASITLCECLNLNKTAVSTVVTSIENFLKKLHCDSIQSTLKTLSNNYNFSREVILKLIFRLMLLQNLEIEGKYAWSKEKILLHLHG